MFMSFVSEKNVWCEGCTGWGAFWKPGVFMFGGQCFSCFSIERHNISDLGFLRKPKGIRSLCKDLC